MNLKQLRESLGLTQGQFAQYLGMPTSNYAAIERKGPQQNLGKVAVAAMAFLHRRGLLMRFLQGYFLMRGKE